MLTIVLDSIHTDSDPAIRAEVESIVAVVPAKRGRQVTTRLAEMAGRYVG